MLVAATWEETWNGAYYVLLTSVNIWRLCCALKIVHCRRTTVLLFLALLAANVLFCT